MKFSPGACVLCPDGIVGVWKRLIFDDISVIRDSDNILRRYPTNTLKVTGVSGPCAGCGIILPVVYGSTYCVECSNHPHPAGYGL